MEALIGLLIIGGLCAILYLFLPKKPFTYGGMTHDKDDVNGMRNFGGGIILIIFVVLVLALIV